jgi:hypothetical protein
MNKEQQELIDEAYKNFKEQIEHGLNSMFLVNDGPNKITPLTQEEFIDRIKTEPDFSIKWGLKIEERELNLEERKSIYEREYTDGMEVPNNNWLNSKLTTRNIPTKLITLTYTQTIESYE